MNTAAMKAFLFKNQLKTKLEDKSGGSHLIEIVLMILVVVVIMGTIFFPQLTEMAKKYMDAADKKTEAILNYMG